MTLFDGEGNRGGSGDGDRSFRRRFPGDVDRDARGREGVAGSTGIAGGSVLGGFAELGLVCLGVFRFEANGWRGLLGVMISTASIIILGLTGVVGLGGTARGAGFSLSSSASSSSTTVGTFFFVVRDRAALVVGFEGPALVVRVDTLEGGLVDGSLAGGGLVEGFLDCGLATTTFSSTSAGRAPALDRVAGCFLVGSGGSKASWSGSVFAVRRVVRALVRDLGGGFAGVTGPFDLSLRRGGSGRGSAGALRLGAIAVRRRTVRDRLNA